MKKTAILLHPTFCEYELSVALSALGQAGKPARTVSDTRMPIRGEAGLSCLSDETYSSAMPDEYDSVLVPGMTQMPPPEAEEKCVRFIEAVNARGGILGAVSLSPYLLARAGALKGRRYTVGMCEEDVEAMDCFDSELLVRENLVWDGNVITAVGAGFVSFGIAFCKALGLRVDTSWYG